MKRYGNIRFNRRMVATLCMFLVAVSILMPMQAVRADDPLYSGTSTLTFRTHEFYDGKESFRDYDLSMKYTCASPVYSFIYESITPTGNLNQHDLFYGFMSTSKISFEEDGFGSGVSSDGVFFYNNYIPIDDNHKLASSKSDIFLLTDGGINEAHTKLAKYLTTGEKSDGMIIGGSGTYDSSLGFLAGVELQQIHDKSKEKKGSPDGSGLMETIIYNDKTTTGVDLKNGDYKIEVAWANAYLNAKSTAYYAEDKKKTTICTFDAKLNCKSADSLKRYYYSVLDANKKCKDNSTDGFEPSMFTIITKHLKSQPTYWYRIVTKDNRYSGWVKIGIKGGGVDDITFPQDTYDNEDNKVDADHGGYHKDNSKEAIGSGDSKDEAIEDSVADSQRKDDNNVINNGSSKDLWDSLKEFVKGVESVPVMIADLFSFLPSWCLGLVASGFALMIALMIINCIKS